MNDAPTQSPAGESFDLSQFHGVFFEEASENLASMEALLLAIDDECADDESMNAIFRCAHSIKGGAATFGFQDVTDLTHVMETLLDKLRRHELAVTVGMIDTLLESGDVLKHLLARHQSGAIDAVDASDLVARIRALAERRRAAGRAVPRSRSVPRSRRHPRRGRPARRAGRPGRRAGAGRDGRAARAAAPGQPSGRPVRRDPGAGATRGRRRRQPRCPGHAPLHGGHRGARRGADRPVLVSRGSRAGGDPRDRPDACGRGNGGGNGGAFVHDHGQGERRAARGSLRFLRRRARWPGDARCARYARHGPGAGRIDAPAPHGGAGRAARRARRPPVAAWTTRRSASRSRRSTS